MSTIDIVLPTATRNFSWFELSVTSILESKILNKLIIVIDKNPKVEFMKKAEYILRNKKVHLISNYGKGVGEALNSGIKFSKAMYVARMDDDDLLLPNRLESQIRFIEETKSDMVFSNMRILGTEFNLSRPGGPVWNPIFLLRCLVPHPTLFGKRETFIKYGLYPRTYVAEDYAFWLKNIAEIRCSISKEVHLEYRVHDNQTSETWSKPKVVNQLYNLWKGFGQKMQVNSKYLSLDTWKAVNGISHSKTNLALEFIDELRNKFNESNGFDSDYSKIINEHENLIIGSSVDKQG